MYVAIVKQIKGKGIQAHTRLPSIRFRSWSRFSAVSLHVTWVINLAIGCHHFPPGLQLPLQPLRGLLPILLLGEQRHDGCEQFAQDCYPTALQLRFEPEPHWGWVQHANHSATELSAPLCVYVCVWFCIRRASRGSASVRWRPSPTVRHQQPTRS